MKSSRFKDSLIVAVSWFFMTIGEGMIFIAYAKKNPIVSIISALIFALVIYEIGRRFGLYENKHKETETGEETR